MADKEYTWHLVKSEDVSLIVAAMSLAVSFIEHQLNHSDLPADRRNNLRNFKEQILDLQYRLAK